MKSRIAVVVLIGLGIAGWHIHDSNLRKHSVPVSAPAALGQAERRISPRLPAPRMQTRLAPTNEPPEFFRPTNLLAKVLNSDDSIKLSLQQVESYLSENRRSSESLIGAFRATGHRALLQEALEKYPNDPQVCCAACFDILHNRDLPEDVRQQRLDAFKKASPDNALPYYLTAENLFKAGRTDEAVQEIIMASGKSKYRDYSAEFMQSSEEAYRAAGYSQVESKAVSTFNLPLPQLSILKQLGQSLGDLATRYQQGGDEVSAQAARQLGVNLARQVDVESTPNCMIDNLVGIAIERQILEQMVPTSLYDNSSKTVKDRLDELANRRTTIKEMNKGTLDFLTGMPEQDIINYFDRLKVFGEVEAVRWAINRQKQP